MKLYHNFLYLKVLFLVEGVYVLLSTNEIYVRYTYFIKILNLAQNKKRHFFKRIRK